MREDAPASQVLWRLQKPMMTSMGGSSKPNYKGMMGKMVSTNNIIMTPKESSSQRRKASKILVHFMKITDDEYLCKNFKVATDETKPRGPRFQAVSRQKLFQTYQF